MISDADFKRLEDYLGNNLSPEEALAFERDMEKNDALKAEYRLQEELNHFVAKVPLVKKLPENERTKSLRSFISSDEADDLKKRINTSFQKAKNKNQFRPYWIAASLAALLSVLGGIYYSSTNTFDPEEIFSAYYDENEIPSFISRGIEDNSKSKISEAFELGNYTESLELFTDYSKNKSEIDTTLFLISGASHLRLENFQGAINDFKRVAESQVLDHFKGQWFLALVYLKTEEYDKAKAILNSLSQDNPRYKQKEISEILKRIENK